MSPEQTPSNVKTISPEAKQQLEAQILAGGEGFDQSRVDAVMSRVALEAGSVVGVEATDAGKQQLAELSIGEHEDTDDIIAAEAARRQIDLNSIYAQQNLKERAAQEGWPQDKYEDAVRELTNK